MSRSEFRRWLDDRDDDEEAIFDFALDLKQVGRTFDRGMWQVAWEYPRLMTQLMRQDYDQPWINYGELLASEDKNVTAVLNHLHYHPFGRYFDFRNWVDVIETLTVPEVSQLYQLAQAHPHWGINFISVFRRHEMNPTLIRLKQALVLDPVIIDQLETARPGDLPLALMPSMWLRLVELDAEKYAVYVPALKARLEAVYPEVGIVIDQLPIDDLGSPVRKLTTSTFLSLVERLPDEVRQFQAQVLN